MKLAQLLLLSAFMAVGLSACSSEKLEEFVPAPVYYHLSSNAPPMPLMEEKPISLDPMHEIWRPGHWTYSGADFYWIPGEYMKRPNPTAAWSPDRWEERMYGWAFIPGYWQ